MRNAAGKHRRLLRITPILIAAGILATTPLAASSSTESQVRQQFLQRSEQAMAIELQSQLLFEELNRLKSELAAARQAASADRAMCGEMRCTGLAQAADALRRHLQSLQALSSSTRSLQKQMHKMAGYAVKTEELLLESPGGLHDQQLAIAVSNALIDFNQIITGNIGTLMKRLKQSTSDFTASAANVGGRTGMSTLSEGKMADLRKAVATALSQTLQEGIGNTFAKNMREPGAASALTNEVLNQATDLITAELYNAYAAKPGAKMEISASAIGLGLVRAGLEGVAKQKLRERQNRAAGMEQQLSENERSRLLWIMQWRLAQRLYKNLQTSETKAATLLAQLESLAQACKIKSRQLKQCRVEADESLQAVSDEHQAKIDAAKKNLEDARHRYQERMKPLEELRQKIAANERKADEWNRKYAEARKNDSPMADSYRESRDMARQAAEDDRLALRSHEIALDAELGSPVRGAQLALQHAIEQRQMAMEFAQNDAMKKVRACLYTDAGQTSPASSTGSEEKEASVLDELLTHTVKVQNEAYAAMQAAKIGYDEEKCGKKKPVTASEAAPPAPPAPGVTIDPAYAGLYSIGYALVEVSVEKERIRGEVVETCEPLQQASGTNFQAGDLYLKGTGNSDRSIDGQLHFKLVSRLQMAEGSRSLECKWEMPRDQWLPARLYQKSHGGLFAIHANYEMPLSLIECGTSGRQVDLLLLSRPMDRSAGKAAVEDAFRRECQTFSANNPTAGRKLEVFRPPEMPEIPVIEEPLLEPEPMLLLPEPPQ